jgi:hypothetical protein
MPTFIDTVIDKLNHEIRVLREQLHDLVAQTTNIRDSRVIELSQLLDEKINMHYQLQAKKTAANTVHSTRSA